MPGLSDGLGDRLLMFDNTATASLELLRFRREFTDVPAFERAVRQRMRALERFEHPGLAKVRAFTSLGEGEGLALVSNHTVGQRLSEVLHAARGPALGLDLIRQLTPVLADLQGQGDDVAHGILTPERIIVTPEGRLVMVEHVLGSALQSVGLPGHRLRSDFGLAARGHDGALGRRGDVVQLGLAALSIVLGRRIDPADYPLKVAALLDELELIDAPGAGDFSRLRRWMQHALQLGGRAFGSAGEAHDALREVLEQRDDSPRENVIAFPTPVVEPVIEITIHDVTSDARLDWPPDVVAADAGPSRAVEPEIDAAAMWRAAQAHAHGFRSAPPRPRRKAADPAAGAHVDERGIRLSIELPGTLFTRLLARLLRRAPAAIPPALLSDAPVFVQGPARRSRLAQFALVGLTFVQSGIIALLLAVPPAPEQIVVTRIVEVPAQGSRPAGATAAAGSLATRATPEGPVAYEPAQKPPASFMQNLADGVRAAPAALGRGIAAAWRATADLVSGLFSRLRESVNR